jgi:hypothetical protein
MRVRHPSLQLVEREVRSEICATCPHRTAGTDDQGPTESRPCECGCPLFVRLPQLKWLAEGVDPMVGSRRNVLTHYLDQVCGRGGCRTARLREHAGRLIDVLEQVPGM